MPFKGVIKIGSTVGVTLAASSENRHVGILLVGLTVDPPGSKRAIVPPGGSKTVSIAADRDSMLEIQVHLESAKEKGTLQVAVNGGAPDEGKVTGHPTWWYSCEP